MSDPIALPQTFLEIAASAPREKVVIWTYCESPQCLVRTDHVLIEVRRGNGETEVYACANCGRRKEYKVT